MLRPLLDFLRRRGVHVYRNSLPWGTDLATDMGRLGLLRDAAVVLDVGANEGNMLPVLRRFAPAATIHAFEPVPATFNRLRSSSAAVSGKVVCHPLAVGATPGRARMSVAAIDTMSHLLEDGESADPSTVVEADVVTLDGWAADTGVDSIDFLKIDTEGYDLEVLEGARTLLERRAIRFVLTEVGFGYSDRHRDIKGFLDLLEPAGMRLLGIYDQSPSPRNLQSKLHLHYSNALFAIETLLES